jgi:hypothetical protein
VLDRVLDCPQPTIQLYDIIYYISYAGHLHISILVRFDMEKNTQKKKKRPLKKHVRFDYVHFCLGRRKKEPKFGMMALSRSETGRAFLYKGFF